MGLGKCVSRLKPPLFAKNRQQTTDNIQHEVVGVVRDGASRCMVDGGWWAVGPAACCLQAAGCRPRANDGGRAAACRVPRGAVPISHEPWEKKWAGAGG